MAQLKANQTSIVEQEFNLLMNQLQLDKDEWRVYKHKLTNYAASVSKLKHDWNLKRHKQSGKAADVFMKQNCLVLVYRRDVTAPVVEFLNWKKQLATGLHIPEERGYTFALLNLSAPNISAAKDMAPFGSCAASLVHGQNLIAVTMPQFAYNGRLALASRASRTCS